MNKSSLVIGALKGRTKSGTDIAGTVFKTGEKVSASNVIPFEVIQMNSLYLALQKRPSDAIVATREISCCYGVFSSEELTHVILTRGNENIVVDVPEKSVYFNGNVGSEAIVTAALAAELVKRGDLFKEWCKLDTSKKWNKNHEKCFLEMDQKQAFGRVSSGLLYVANKMLDTAIEYSIKGAKPEEDAAAAFKSIKGTPMDLIGLFTKENKLEEMPENLQKERARYIPELKKTFPVLRGKIEIFGLEEVKPLKPAKDERKEFFATDWSMMTDEEAEKLPEDLRISREECREQFKTEGKFLTDDQITWVRRFYKGTAQAMLFRGDAGTGKTTTARLIAGALNLPMQHVTGDGESGAEDYLGGVILTVDAAGNSRTAWVDGPVVKAMRHGALLLFDEVNICRANMLGTLHSILDDVHGIEVKATGEFVRCHKNFRFIGTMNSGEGYEGTNNMNNAFLTRMSLKPVFEAFTEDKYISILKKETGYTNERVLRKLVQISNFTRKGIDNPVDQFTSIREVISWIYQAAETGEWVRSSIDTFISSLTMNEDEPCGNMEDIATSSTFAAEVLSLIKELLDEEEY